VFLERAIFQTKVVEIIKIHILCSEIFFFRKSCLFCVKLGKYGTTRQATDDNILWRMRFACRINKATDTRSEYVILVAFQHQQWLRERPSVLRYTYIACALFVGHSVRADCIEYHTASYTLATAVLSTCTQQIDCETQHSPPFNIKIKNS
jgi:hypothetical protein